MSIKVNFASIFKTWRSPFITRASLHKLTEGMVNQKTMRNLDSLGIGVAGRFNLSPRKVAYPVTDVIAWLESRYSRVSTAKPAKDVDTETGGSNA